jgi:peptidoglycan/LPS O-acetylase OafA/YrhL
MKTGISFRALAIALGVALIPSYVLCILGGEVFGWHMYQSWAPLLPGFTWPVTLGGFVDAPVHTWPQQLPGPLVGVGRIAYLAPPDMALCRRHPVTYTTNQPNNMTAGPNPACGNRPRRAEL